jgi:hypothetical protein
MPSISPYSHRFRAAGGAAGSPAALLTSELCYNMQDGIWYAGFGDDGGGNATSILPAFSVNGSLSWEVKPGGAALQVYRKNSANNGYEWATLSGGNTYTGSNGIAVDGAFNITADATIARLASPIFTGSPTAPTQLDADNSTKVATTAYVTTKITALLGGAAAAYDTFVEIQALMQADDTQTASILTSLSGKLTVTANLSDLGNIITARGNLGLASMATQAANAVAITGGTITGVAIRGGTF